MQSKITVYVLDTGKTIEVSTEDLRVSLALARLHTGRVDPPTPSETVVLDRVESLLASLESE